MGSLPARELHVSKVLPGGIRRPLDHRTETFPWLRLTGQSRGHSAGFRPSVVKDCIHAVLKEELANAEYSPEEMPQLTKHLSENIKDKLKEMGFDRYKMVVQVVIGEQRGEGVLKDLTLLLCGKSIGCLPSGTELN
nr:tctex1 domain-containing protein 2 isoform X3 [Chlorocebus sabaeus]